MSGPPPRQFPYDQALQRGFETLICSAFPASHWRDLGATREGTRIRLPALGRWLCVDLSTREVRVESEARVRQTWAVLVVHYLCAPDTTPDARDASFAHFCDAQPYLGVFTARTVQRFLRTVGRTAEVFEGAAERLGGSRLPGPGVAYCFHLLPRVPLTIVRYEGDSEIAAGATIVYPADAARLLPTEDRVVAVELLLDALQGKPIAEVRSAAPS